MKPRVPIARAIVPFARACARLGVPLTPRALLVHVRAQQMFLLRLAHFGFRISDFGFRPPPPRRSYVLHHAYRISTSRSGTGQVMNSRQTPLGLHRVARKLGGGWPPGAVFRSRQLAGYTWHGLPHAEITHRILWLEGLEPGFNRGGAVDSFARYIYIHGFWDESSLGRPVSAGCIHLAGEDLLPLFDRLPCGTLVWITGD